MAFIKKIIKIIVFDTFQFIKCIVNQINPLYIKKKIICDFF